MVGKVYITVQTPEGEIIERENTKLSNFNDDFFEQCKKAHFEKSPNKLISVRFEKSRYKTNPEWKKYNDFFNEGEEGYNPHEQMIFDKVVEKIWKV
jgi:hypothetical protein